MRNLTIFILLFISVFLNAQDYWVTPRGNDSNAGTDSSSTGAWLTIQKSFDTADAGDTVYIKSGTYYTTSALEIDPTGYTGDPQGNNGTFANRVCFIGDPDGETPIIDSRNNCDGFSGYNQTILINQAEYLTFKNLEITNSFLCASNQVSGAISWVSSANLTFEEVTVHQVGQRGYWGLSGYWDSNQGASPFDSDTTLFINCDTYNICDTFVNDPGNAGDGWKLQIYENNYYHWRGCRAWNYSDDGFDISGQGQRVFDSCWAMPSATYNEYDIEGNGFKFGAIDPQYFDGSDNETNFIIVRNCIALFGVDQGSGFYDLDYAPYRTTRGLYYNNLAYDMGYGFRTNNVTDTLETATWINNISLSNDLLDVVIYTLPYVEHHNTWDSDNGYPWYITTDTVTVTSADFVFGLDSTTLVQKFTAPRVDGELPVHPFTLSPTSDLINAGYDLGYPFYGTAPDIGAYQYNPGDPNNPSYRFSGHSGGKTNVIGGKVISIRK